MQTTWIVVADASRARILQVAGRENALTEVEDLVNPQGRMHNREINSDAAGRFRGHDRPGGHASDDENRTVDHYTEAFAKRVGEFLDSASNKRRFDRLFLVAAPKVLGQLRKELGKETEKLVADDLARDLAWFNVRQLEEYVARGSARAP